MMHIPDYPWFGPRHGMGWGWAPVSWEGKTIIAAVAAILAISVLTFGRSRKTLYIVGGSIVFLLAVCAITGTTPG